MVINRSFYVPIVLVVLFSMCKYFVHSYSLNGRYTKSIENYKLTVPHKLSSNGEFESFNIPQYFKHDFEKKRKKRGYDDPDLAHYGVTLNGKDYHIELWPNHDFLSPNLIFENRDPKLRKQYEKIRALGDEDVCHYTGQIRGKHNSRAALSTCDGLAGYISLDNVQYFIEPVEDHQANSEGHHLHVMYQSQPDGEKGSKSNCGTETNWEEAWKSRFRERYMNENMDQQKRGLSSEQRYLETLVVADKKFITYHKNRDIETYIMTVMNMVSDFYHDASSGNQMDVVLVRIMYLEKEEEEIDLEINTNAEKTIASFCKWQQRINPKDIENPTHHDIAVLLTRYDICASTTGTSCGLTGLGYIAGACTGNLNCALCEDMGLVLGTTVAHEMGHVMGCAHDKQGESSCPAQDKDESYFVMAPSVHIFTTKWSSCSREFMTALFENNLGDCLNDEPQVSMYKYKNVLPGTIYDIETQCNFIYPGSKLCKGYESTFCQEIKCRISRKKCASSGEPPADGTKCGANKWCFHRKCIEIGERPQAVNGGWGSWSSWSQCSRTCGGGVSMSERACDNPTPEYGGRYCLGDRKKVKICNVDKCPPNQPTFREIQCAEHNKIPFQNKLLKWKPFIRKEEPCVLYCITPSEHFMHKLEPRVKDGTPCALGTKNMCIAGSCRKVGCDNKLDSTAEEDICGICNGDGTQCKIVDEVYRDSGAHDYKKVATIPAGSRNVKIEELAPSRNTLAISDKTERKFYLNGDHKELHDGSIHFGRVEGVYSHPAPGKEIVIIHGPLTEDLIFWVVFYTTDNVGYRYSYAEQSSDLNYTPHYHWEVLDWGDCSVKCGGGVQTSTFQCVEDKAGKVSANFCTGEEKPESMTKKCNEQPCKTRWKYGRWSACRACKNHSGQRVREVDCVRESPKPGAEDILVEDNQCKGRKPGTRELCRSNKKCRTRNTDGIPEDLLRDVWSQINRRKEKRRELNIDGLIKAIDSNEVCETKNASHVKPDVGKLIKDKIPEEDIKMIQMPFKQDSASMNLSDNAFETMGDSVGDNIDTGNAEIATGKVAAKMLKELQHETTEGCEKGTTP